MIRRSAALLSILFWLSSVSAGGSRTVGEPAIRSTGEHVAPVARSAPATEYLPGPHKQLSDRRGTEGPTPPLAGSGDVAVEVAPRLEPGPRHVARIPIADPRAFPYDATAPPTGSP